LQQRCCNLVAICQFLVAVLNNFVTKLLIPFSNLAASLQQPFRKLASLVAIYPATICTPTSRSSLAFLEQGHVSYQPAGTIHLVITSSDMLSFFGLAGARSFSIRWQVEDAAFSQARRDLDTLLSKATQLRNLKRKR
jgi:hypothetical protein